MLDFTERQSKVQSQIQSSLKILTPLSGGQTQEIEFSYQLDKEGGLSVEDFVFVPIVGLLVTWGFPCKISNKCLTPK